MPEFYVAPSGDDAAPGTADRPFATVSRAQQAAREAAGEVVVHLSAGRYVLAEPLRFTADDSGRDGHRIVYQADGYGTGAQGQVVISGGREITDWQVRDGVWLADVGDLDTRQLVVDGRRAERAGVDGLPGTVSRTATGYITDSADPLGWQAPASVEFVYRGIYPWTEARCGVATVARTGGSTSITMVQPAFGWAVEVYNYEFGYESMAGPGLPTRVENDPSFLREPGTFVLDRSRPGNHVLHYLPRPGEHPLHTPVVAPALETLLYATETRDVSFRGLTFADATWLRPNGNRGFLHYHGCGYYDGGPVYTEVLVEGQQWLTVPTTTRTIPACVRLEATRGLLFEACHFTGLGATALGSDGSTDLTVRGCDFDSLSAAAVAITSDRGALLEDNLIERIGLDFPGSPGISLLNTSACTVSHNQVGDVPHCGIVAGPGHGTRIQHNRMHDTMGILADGGGIYVSGPQGDSAADGALVSGNVIEDTKTPYNFGLYTDYGATWVTVEGNVVARADNTAILTVSPPLEHVAYRDNIWDADPVGSDPVPEGVTYENNATLTDPTEFDTATAAIRSHAGLSHARETTRQRPD
ncbi:right-handed parallel beta-helix repeat-containing protein [Nocardia sp. Marseille-Q1738]